ncbi:WAT1-related protein At4g30420 [Vitis vinifera]|uniref:WAT1-related protein At4g30420 n=1 Tax=Vitis vinifera TaxID=29760 RepID=UPI00288346AA|nr:WAT1-related protein At4g30420 [Vitis vinifera]
MIAIQFIYAVMSISSRAALLKGMSPRVFVVYRQAMATLAIEKTKFMTISIRARRRSGHHEGSMLGSNIEDAREQTRGKETEPIARGRGRKDKSRDVVANLEARLAKVELAMANTREGLDLIEQSMENGMKDLREQIQDLREGILISQIQPMSHEEFVLPRKVLSILASMESRMEALATRMEEKSARLSLGWRGFSWIFLASIIGVTVNQNLCFEEMYLVSSFMSSVMINLVPALTILIASMIGLEKINIRSLRSIAKIAGTVFCAGGANSMTLLKGPKLLNTEFLPTKSAFGSGGQNWLLGCLFLFAGTCCWSLWLILQVPISATYPDSLSSSAWMCFFSTLQSAVVSFFLEQDPKAWILRSKFELVRCLYSGIIGSGLNYFLQAWCISRRGPLFSAMFNPLCTVIVTILDPLSLHEELYIGSLVGAVAVIIGLYVVLWGKAKDLEESQTVSNPELQNNEAKNVRVLIDESSNKTSCTIDLKEPLLPSQSN